MDEAIRGKVEFCLINSSLGSPEFTDIYDLFSEIMPVDLTHYLTAKGVNAIDATEITPHFAEKTVSRNEVLEPEGKVCKHLYFVQKGVLRLYEIDSKGDDITGYFALEGNVITAVTSFITGKPSRDFLVAMEPSTIGVVPRDKFFHLTEKYPSFAKVYHQFVEFALIHSQMRIYSFLGMEGIEKLRWVMEHEPQLLQRISSKAVASYLGMTNSTLSKLRNKL
jgi:CRP-like cAMP-binding protein